MPEATTNNDNQQTTDGNGAGSQQADEQQKSPLTWDGWFTGQSDEVKDVIEGHISGLKNALESERSERKKLSAQIKDLAGKAEAGSEMRQQLDSLNGDLEVANLRADFFEYASTSEVSNLRLAMIAAKDAGLFNDYLDKRSGKVNFEKVFEVLKSDYPELFKKATVTTNTYAGGGTKTTTTTPLSMNDRIRAARH